MSKITFQDPSGRAWISSIIKSGVGTPSSLIQSPSCARSSSDRKANNRCLGQHTGLYRIKSLDTDVSNDKKIITGNVYCSFENY